MMITACSDKDDSAPFITILGDNPMSAPINDPAFTDPGATAIDDTDGDITASIVVTSTVNLQKKGQYLITYAATDAAGNRAEATRFVHIINEADYLTGTYAATDNKVDPQGSPSTTNYTDMVTACDTANNYFWVNQFGGYENAKVRIRRVSNSQCQVEQQEISCGIPPVSRRFLGTANILDSTRIIINYTEISGGQTWTGSSTYERN